ncbi:MAG: DUF177 domain-containing protein [Caldisericota bacterium]|nr:DUF177 domain-containing protein [Caldisericota bacterium]
MEKEPLRALINVAQLLKEPVGSSQSYDISGMINEEVEGFVEGKAKLIHISQGVLVQCKLTAEVKLICSRCLDAFLFPISFTAEEEFLPISDVSGDLALSSPEQSEEFTIDNKNILDLSELIRQYTLLNLPMKPLCRPDCPGIN